ncbi:MAG TPA: hypothetical protein VJ044_03135, partial [Candidatus Hodarchaeales archaeon]|nr:hypothetical protein [Candidatus Hodarchaeales archaeon]
MPVRISTETYRQAGALSNLEQDPRIELLGLHATGIESHEYVLTNRENVHWTGETSRLETRKWHGLVKNRWTTLTNIWLDRAGQETTKDSVINAIVYPNAVKTVFSLGNSELSEQLFLPPGHDLLVVQYLSNFSDIVSIRPQFGLRKDWAATGRDYSYTYNNASETLFVTTSAPDYQGPRYVGVRLSSGTIFYSQTR